MPLRVVHSKAQGKWFVKEPSGKVLGTHSSARKAWAQVAAIEHHKKKGK